MSLLDTYETTPKSSRTLNPAATRRVIFRLAPSKVGEAFDLKDAGEFAKALQGKTMGRPDHTVGVFEGRYIVDFPNVNPIAAVKRIGTALFDGIEHRYAHAAIDEVRVTEDGQNIQDMQPGEAWVHMTEVTSAADKMLELHRGELLADAAFRAVYAAVLPEGVELREPSPTLPA